MYSVANLSQNVTLPALPELFDESFLDRLLPPQAEDWTMLEEADAHPQNAMMEALKSTANRTRTANYAQAYSSTTDPVLDAFNQIGKYTSASEMARLLDAAWKADRDLTLRLIWYTRSIHDGKAEKDAFYRAFAWLYENHPRTAIANLRMLVAPVCVTSEKKGTSASHGYWKDLLNLVSLAACDELHTRSRVNGFKCFKIYTPRGTKSGDDARVRDERAKKGKSRHEKLVEHLADARFRALYVAVARTFAEQLEKDLGLLEEISKAESKTDKAILSKQLSLAGKWAPTPGGAHDRVSNLSTAISSVLCYNLLQKDARLVPSVLRSPPEALAAAANPELCLTLRSYLRRWYLAPLRTQLGCPEPLMSAGRWTEINYARVPAVCMKTNTDHFFRHDPDGFQKYLLSVERGTRTIAGATLLPHELIGAVAALAPELGGGGRASKYPLVEEARRAAGEMKMRVLEAQWGSLVERLRGSGRLDNALAICDVSGSMGSLCGARQGHCDAPIFPAVALSLLLASVARPPFDGGFITFSSAPEFVRLELRGRRLADVVAEMGRAGWGMNTDFGAVFLKLLLPLAKKHHVPREEMVKRLFVFSDMQFDAAARARAVDESEGPMSGSLWETNHDAIERAYAEAGYDMPEIVYWDLSMGSRQTVEVEATRKGVALMSGFSAGMMKVFLGEEGAVEEQGAEAEDGEKAKVQEEFNPVNVMKKALGKASFDGLVVVD